MNHKCERKSHQIISKHYCDYVVRKETAAVELVATAGSLKTREKKLWRWRKERANKGDCWVLLLRMWGVPRLIRDISYFVHNFVRASLFFFKLILLFIVSPIKQIRKRNVWNGSIGCRFCRPFVLHLFVYHFP